MCVWSRSVLLKISCKQALQGLGSLDSGCAWLTRDWTGSHRSCNYELLDLKVWAQVDYGALPSSGQRCSELGKNGRYYLVLGTVG